jgi:hypothetical protein
VLPGVAPREVPSRVYFDLATWHLINTGLHGAARARTAPHAQASTATRGSTRG